MRAFAPKANPASLTDTPPIAEATAANAGNVDLASRGNHQHPRLTSAIWGVTNASGEVPFTFTRLFASKPSIDFTYEESQDNQPIIFKVKSWTQDGNGNYTGCVAKGYRLQTLPSSIALLTVLINFSVSVNAPAGIALSCIALLPSNV